ncbi:tRNA pseudouridine(13) synthase TruD [Acidihalobacter ferrooxydans]|uniref:tRNA pseudouridine synthase D n=1 Tax=Acidihalobacter ferrooxydans TaxID=1765967 RepID=A0A1P8ULI1_9GAMM|nr:tRNA pseudouridine(13) synthase TruD [Acidihalobacter ferrooxydans]
MPRSGASAGHGVIRAQRTDFIVEELPVQEPSGEGEHLWLWVEKQGENTEAVARRLARAAGVKPLAVGYAGRKDRHALTRQWFSVPLPRGQAWPAGRLASENIRVLRTVRHTRKLRVGALRGNRFVLRITELEADPVLLERRLQAVREQGVPNYFGEQRFGRSGGNVDAALRLFAGHVERDRKRRGLYLSAARSALFNGILAERIRAGTWNVLCPGEAVMLDGSNSFFVADEIDDVLQRRLREGDIHPSGALWGSGELPPRAAVSALELAVAGQAAALSTGLMAAGLKHERRPLRLLPKDMVWRVDEGARALILEFTLPAGAFATAVLHDLLHYRDGAQR